VAVPGAQLAHQVAGHPRSQGSAGCGMSRTRRQATVNVSLVMSSPTCRPTRLVA
jgi:hypothetical protein